MKKIALYVEGQTERIFLSELLKQLFTARSLHIEAYKIESYRTVQIDTFTTNEPKDYYFMIFDCGADDQVKSKIIEDFHGLRKAGYSHIIGLQDLFNPQRRKKGIDDNKYRESINNGLPDEIPTKIFFAIQETEAWFIAEENHYAAISSDLTLELVNSIAGINVQINSTQEIRHPTVVLDKIYKAGGRKHGYSKNEYVVKDVVSKLDYDNLYLNVRNRNDSLGELLTCLDGFIP